MRLLLATANEGKLREFRAALSDTGHSIIAAREFGILPSPRETGKSFAANARIKARHYFQLTGVASLSDDSGLMVDALRGEPGIHSARYAPTTRERIAKLLGQLAHIPPDDFPARRAHFVCALCLYGPMGMIEVESSVSGVIIDRPRGESGFGYDPVFYYPPLKKTFAELSSKEKNRISHRAKALVQLRARLARYRDLPEFDLVEDEPGE